MQRIILAIMAITIGFSSMAQKGDSTFLQHKEFRNKKNQRGKQDFSNLNLTEDQKAQIKTLNDSLRQQMQDLQNDKSISAEDVKTKRMALVKEHREKVNAILTSEQRKQMEDMSEKFAKGNKDQMPARRFEEMTKDLNLTQEQSIKMNDLSKSFRTNMQSIRQNTSLSQDEKRDQIKSLMKKHQTDMETLLTDEQKEQLKNNMNKRHNEAVK